jgi:L-serine dehydratase
MISIFDLFKIGIGPSSSHTVGPMKAGRVFAEGLRRASTLKAVARFKVTLFGSLAFTGRGHGTDKAVILGLSGHEPARIDPDLAEPVLQLAFQSHRLRVDNRHEVEFDPAQDIVLDTLHAPLSHPNTLTFEAIDATGAVLAAETWCSIGGGFIARQGDQSFEAAETVALPYPFRNAAQLLEMGQASQSSIAAMVRANELARVSEDELGEHIDNVVATMMACIERGLSADGLLPGGLNVRRRAKALLARIEASRMTNQRAPHEVMDHVSAYAIAVNEENASGGRVVTAPTNGAAGVVPAVLRYYRDFCPGATPAGMTTFLLSAAAVGALFKMNASISGAEVGCQGEVGVACSMAAAGLAAALGGSNEQVENAAEIGMEHHLGMTCDPIGGLVQIPCIERNAFGAVKAINAASLAINGDGRHHVSLDQVIATMRQTGADMQAKYKETSLGGLAVNFIEC